ncbi:sodium:alanine symporter family protein [Clostridiaceae bacterium 35-E11]
MAKALEAISKFMWGTPLLVIILFTGMFFTFATGFFQFRYFGHIMKQTFGKLTKKDDEKGEGLLSSFEAVSTAIGGSVGVGNIGGVATAIAVGGPGSVFWMWLCALLGILIKNVEVTLAVHYRMKDEQGNPYGGAPYYMERGLGEEKGIKGWSILSTLFTLGMLLPFLAPMQTYTISEAISGTFNIPILAVAVTYVGFTYIIIWKGIAGVGKIASKVVPFMCLCYVLGGLFIIFKNASTIPESFALIISGAFNGTAAAGGFAGAAFAKVIRIGIARSVYSNEAGWGSSPLIHSTARVDHPVKQGLWGSFEVFVDTIIVSTVTALIIIVTGAWQSGASGATLTLNAFESELGYVGRIVMTIGIFLFGLTTGTGWYTYLEMVLRHLFRKNVAMKIKVLTFFKRFYMVPGITMVFIAVTVGIPTGYMWYFADIASALPTFVNVLVILLLSGKYFQLLKDYKARYLGIGQVDPEFCIFYEDQKNKTVKVHN